MHSHSCPSGFSQPLTEPPPWPQRACWLILQGSDACAVKLSPWLPGNGDRGRGANSLLLFLQEDFDVVSIVTTVDGNEVKLHLSQPVG